MKILLLILTLFTFVSCTDTKSESTVLDQTALPGNQLLCPVEGGKISKDDFVEYKGQKIYFCCEGCDKEFLNNPEKFLGEMKAKGITPEKVK